MQENTALFPKFNILPILGAKSMESKPFYDSIVILKYLFGV
jgi:hypothetical protein